jgi:hypothetical protein
MGLGNEECREHTDIKMISEQEWGFQTHCSLTYVGCTMATPLAAYCECHFTGEPLPSRMIRTCTAIVVSPLSARP